MNAIVDFVEYALTAAFLAIAGFPNGLEQPVAVTLVDTVPNSTNAAAIDGFLQIKNPTPADYSAGFASVVSTLTQGGYVTPDKVRQFGKADAVALFLGYFLVLFFVLSRYFCLSPGHGTARIS